MTGTLLRKELQQHWLAFLLLALVTFGAVGLISFTMNMRGVSGSVFMGLLVVFWFILPPVALLLSQRLVALEFREKTQLFLEPLPLPRWRMITIKYALGLAVTLVLVLGALALTAFFGRNSEVLTPRFGAILAARAAGWGWFVFSFFFVTGFFGRYRFLFFLALGAAYGLCDHYTNFRAEQFGPFALVDTRFPYESTAFPVPALRTTGLLSLGLVGLGFLLGLVREGTVGALLGEKMSHREKMFVTAMIMAALITMAVFEERKKRAPFDLPGATEESRGTVVVKVGVPLDADRRRGYAVAARAADELSALSEYLSLETLPPVFIVLRPDLDAQHFERLKLEETSDVVVRANFNAAAFVERDFLDWLVREVLVARSRGRLELERKRWVLDGFAVFWKGHAQAAAPLSEESDLAARARRGAANAFSPADLGNWLSFSKKVGEEDAKGVAWSGLRTLARRHGTEACRGFLRAVLSPAVAKDARATWHDLLHPVTGSLETAAGVRFDLFFAEWQEELAALPAPSPAP
ncbi:MAG: hypothetical protein QOE70_4596 [Chthoniobacter sp.]|jgi:hypothetical protein|nr:hypothetical protein [Chthoniobacter sp.]